jgi:hypothetical protein
MHVDLIEADGRADAYTVAADAFPTSRVNSFNGFKTWAGDSLGLEIYDIKIVDDHAEFKTRGNRVSPVPESSSSSAKVSSSSVAESSSSKESSSSVEVSSSSVRSAVKESSSSANRSSSSVVASSSSRMEISAISSSSENTMIAHKMRVASMVKFSVSENVLLVNAKMAGLKTVNLFDANGTLLKSQSFNGESCEIHMETLRGKTFIVATLESDGRLIKSYKVRMN